MKIELNIEALVKYMSRKDIDNMRHYMELFEVEMRSIITKYPPKDFENKYSYSKRISDKTRFDIEYIEKAWDYK